MRIFQTRADAVAPRKIIVDGDLRPRPRCTGLIGIVVMTLATVFWPGFCQAWAQTQSDAGSNGRLLMFPFAVYADHQDDSTAAGTLAAFLSDKLARSGIDVIRQADETAAALSVDQKKKLALEQGAGAALWGSLTLLGDRFSIDLSLVKTEGDAEVSRFFDQGESVKAFDRTATDLTKNIVGVLSARAAVAGVEILGHARIEAEAIKRVIATSAGDAFDQRQLSDDLRAIYRMGYFEDVRVAVRESSGGKTVVFYVKERPTVRKILFKGNMVFDDEEMTQEVSISRGAIVNIPEIQRYIKQLEMLYREKNYHNIRISFAVLPADNNQADIEFTIEEGEKFRIQRIEFEGNRVYGDKALKDIIKTAEKGVFMWIISSAGDLKPDVLQQDMARLTAYYHDHGYINAKIGEPEITYGTPPEATADEDQPRGIFIKIKIEEGNQYKIGKISLAGDLIDAEETLREKLHITENTVFNRSALRMDLMRLSDLYSDQGYYYVDVYPDTAINDEDLTVDIVYRITQGSPVYFDDIIITGNTKTRDKVIRRQLDIYEQDLYSGQGLKRSIARLYRLNYFDNVGVDIVEKPAEKKIDLKIEVEEKPTGEFSFGGGYSSTEDLFASASISQSNLFGRGQTLQIQGQVGGTTTQFKLSFTEPWLFDIPLSAGIDLYDWEVDYDSYTMDTRGGGLRFGYPAFKNTRFYLSNNYESNSIKDVYADAPSSILDLVEMGEDDIITSSISASLVYDTRDNIVNPRRGAKHSITVENAGGLLGGDVAFTKYTTELGWYIPLFWKLVGFVHSEGGYIHKNSDGYLPDYERFYLGGINSLRGYDWRDISILETDQEGNLVDERGGDKFVQFNLELLFPLFGEDVGLVGLLFYDTGNVYDEGDPIDLSGLRESVGFGIRWYSPMGPIRLERGYILDPREGEDSGGRWEFSMGTAF